MTITRLMTMLACGAMLALGACTDTKRVPVGDPMADEKIKKETDRANAAQAALNDLRDSLADVQNALKPDPSATPEQQRENLRKRLTDVKTNLGMVQENLQKQPASAARTAVDTALTAVGTAVEAVKTALAPTPASGGTVSFADMHMDLDAAQAALDDAQTKITAALGADGLTDTLQTALTQAQAALTTAQVSLVPRLRSELMQAEDDAAAQKARADAEKERADTYDPRLTLNDALEPATPGGARVNRGKMNAKIDYMARTSHTGKDAPTAAPTVVDPANPTTAEQAALDAYNAQFKYPYWDADGMAVDDLADAAAAGDLKIRMAAVRHADGKRLFGAGRSSDELPLRGFTLRHDVRDAADVDVVLAAGLTTTVTLPDGAKTEVVIAAGTTTTLSNANRVLPFQGREVIGDIDTDFDLTDNTWKNFEATFRSSIQLPSSGTSGPTLKMGGQGVIFYDLEQRRRAVGGYCPSGQTGTHCDDATTDDMQVAFTSQAVQDPSGYPAWYWDTDVPFNRAGRNSGLFDKAAYVLGAEVTDANNADFGDSDDATDGGYTGPTDIDRVGLLDIDGDGKADRRVFDTSYGSTPNYELRPLYATPRHMCGQIWCNPDDPRDSGTRLSQGEYQLLLSNYAGENAETAAADDHRYLQYASYGLFAFHDYILAGTYERAGYPRPSRLQAFHFGYDAFADKDGMKTTDLAEPITATFKGATTGWLFPGSDLVSQYDHIRDPIRMRGEVELTATIGGANEISGYMRDFEFLRDGVWRPNPRQVEIDPLPNAARSEGIQGYVHTGYSEADLGNAVRLKTGAIAADGSYTGIAQAIHTGGGTSGGGGTHYFQDGEYEGNFYGPVGDLETAGAWYLQEHLNIAGGARGGYGSIVGAFGARSVPEE